MLCGGCTREPPRYDRARAVLRYDQVSRGLLLGFKHGDRTDGAPAYGGWLAQAGSDLIDECDVILPVPLHRRRRGSATWPVPSRPRPARTSASAAGAFFWSTK